MQQTKTPSVYNINSEAILDLLIPVFVNDIEDGQALVVDEDGGERWVSVNRLDAFVPTLAST